MPPKGSKKRAGSVSASSFDDLTATVHTGHKSAGDALVETTHIAEKGAAVAHKIINNKSGRPQDILTTYDMAYSASSTYMTPKGKHFDASPPVWVIYWFLISATVMLWDAGYLLTREKYSDQLWREYLRIPLCVRLPCSRIVFAMCQLPAMCCNYRPLRHVAPFVCVRGG